MLVNNNSNNQNKAVAYVRVSSQKQAEDGVSIAAQIKRIKEYAKFKGITLEDEDILIEKGVSGGIPLWERPMGGKLKRMLNSGNYEHVMTMKLDRMFRLVSDMLATVDELNAYIGLIKDQEISTSIKDSLLKIQNELFTLGAMLATPKEKETLKSGAERLNIPKIDSNSILFLENEIDSMEEDLPQMTHFILPGGHQSVSFCHVARCVCRRSERLCVELNDEETINNDILKYLNRLSDYLFVLARKLSKDLSVQEIKWIPKKNN